MIFDTYNEDTKKEIEKDLGRTVEKIREKRGLLALAAVNSGFKELNDEDTEDDEWFKMRLESALDYLQEREAYLRTYLNYIDRYLANPKKHIELFLQELKECIRNRPVEYHYQRVNMRFRVYLIEQEIEEANNALNDAGYIDVFEKLHNNLRAITYVDSKRGGKLHCLLQTLCVVEPQEKLPEQPGEHVFSEKNKQAFYEFEKKQYEEQKSIFQAVSIAAKLDAQHPFLCFFNEMEQVSDSKKRQYYGIFSRALALQSYFLDQNTLENVQNFYPKLSNKNQVVAEYQKLDKTLDYIDTKTLSSLLYPLFSSMAIMVLGGALFLGAIGASVVSIAVAFSISAVALVIAIIAPHVIAGPGSKNLSLSFFHNPDNSPWNDADFEVKTQQICAF